MCHLVISISLVQTIFHRPYGPPSEDAGSFKIVPKWIPVFWSESMNGEKGRMLWSRGSFDCSSGNCCIIYLSRSSSIWLAATRLIQDKLGHFVGLMD